MDVNLEKLDQSRVKLTIEADADKLEEGLDYAYRKVNKRIIIPGFRKGKAPRQILERHFGQEILYEDALDYLLPKLYQEAVSKKELHPVEQPDIKLNKIEPNEGLSFEVEVDVYPEVELGEYLGLPVEKHIKTVTDKDIDSELEDLRLRHSELMAVDSRKDVQEGDFANIDFKGYLDGQPFPGGAAEGHTLEIGAGRFIPGFEEQLVGMEVGDEKEITLTFPDDYHSPDLAGKETVFSVKINSIKQRVLPELDDEFAKDISEFATLAELREDIRAKLAKAITDETKREMENKLIEQIISNSIIELPNSMIEQQIDYQVNYFRTNLMYSGMNLETYLEYTNKTEDQLRNDMRPAAINQIKRSLLITEIADKEGIMVSEEEINHRIDQFVEESSTSENVRETWETHQDELENMLKIEKTWEFLFNHAEVTEVNEVTEVTAEHETDE